MIEAKVTNKIKKVILELENGEVVLCNSYIGIFKYGEISHVVMEKLAENDAALFILQLFSNFQEKFL